MKTIKLPITNYPDIKRLRGQQSSVMRYGYNRFWKGLKLKDIEKGVKTLNNIELLDSWLVRSALMKAKAIYSKDKKTKNKTIFGGKLNWIKLVKNKITKEDYKNKRLSNLYSEGDKAHKGNRKFSLDIENKQITLKVNKKEHYPISFKLREKSPQYKHLLQLQEKANNKEMPFSVELNDNYIYITFDEGKLGFNENRPIVKGRTLGIDLNPNYIGVSITDFPKGEVIHKSCFELKELTKKLYVASSDPKQIYQNNKLKHETIHLAKEIKNLALHFKVETIVIEDLNIKPKDAKLGKNFNRLANNKWLRNLFSNKLKSYCLMNNIKLKEVNAAYTSYIGNLSYDDFDPISSSREIARRGYYKFQKGKFYPTLDIVKQQWKQMATMVDSWVELAKQIKNSGSKYRVPLCEDKVVYSSYNIKKKVKSYFFV